MRSGWKTGLAWLATLLLATTLYLCCWPVPIEPLAWQAPENHGYVDPFAANDRLAAARGLELGADGPESAAIGPDGKLYVSTSGGDILRLSVQGTVGGVYAHPGGRPLGLAFDKTGHLWVANALIGLQRVDPDGSVSTVLQEVDKQPLAYANAVDVAADGRIYLSDSSAHFAPAAWGGPYAASLLDILEHGGSGRVIEYQPASGVARVLARDLDFPNGVAVSADQRFLLVAETGSYRIWRYARDSGVREKVIDNLPGFPDNLTRGLRDRIWVGLVAPRNALLDRLSDQPFLRRVVQRLPAFLRPRAQASSHVIAITPDGQVLMDLQDTRAGLPALTGVLETRDALYLTSLFGSRLGRLDKRALAPR